MPDAYLNRREQMFPRLTAAQLERIAPFGERRATHAGEVLFRPGDPTPSFYVILEGSVEESRDPRARFERWSRFIMPVNSVAR